MTLSFFFAPFRKVWDIESLNCVRTLTSSQRPETCCVWQDGIIFVGVEEDGKLRVYDTTSDTPETLKEHASAVLALCATDDIVVSASYDGTTKVWTELDVDAE